MARHARTVEPKDHAEDARRFAENISSTLSDDERQQVVDGAHLIAEGLTELCDGNQMLASKVAMAFAKLLSMMAKTPLEQVGQIIDNTVCGYGLACGSLAGSYDLPPAQITRDDVLTKIKERLADLRDDETAVRVPDFDETETHSPNEAVKYL